MPISQGCDHAKTPDPETGIARYFHCHRCMQELPPGVSAREFTNYEVGLLPDGRVRVWCKRHELLVVDWPLKARA